MKAIITLTKNMFVLFLLCTAPYSIAMEKPANSVKQQIIAQLYKDMLNNQSTERIANFERSLWLPKLSPELIESYFNLIDQSTKDTIIKSPDTFSFPGNPSEHILAAYQIIREQFDHIEKNNPTTPITFRELNGITFASETPCAYRGFIKNEDLFKAIAKQLNCEPKKITIIYGGKQLENNESFTQIVGPVTFVLRPELTKPIIFKQLDGTTFVSEIPYDAKNNSVKNKDLFNAIMKQLECELKKIRIIYNGKQLDINGDTTITDLTSTISMVIVPRL